MGTVNAFRAGLLVFPVLLWKGLLETLKVPPAGDPFRNNVQRSKPEMKNPVHFAATLWTCFSLRCAQAREGSAHLLLQRSGNALANSGRVLRVLRTITVPVSAGGHSRARKLHALEDYRPDPLPTMGADRLASRKCRGALAAMLAGFTR